MRILLTNDDGINAHGINALYEKLSKKHSVYVIAPDSQKSGCSSAITMQEELKIQILSENRYSVRGFTADCVNIGLKGDIIPAVDLVLSGINHGPNCGDDIYFSGTLAGARVAYIYGISGIAVSLDCRDENSPQFSSAAEFIADFIDNSDFINSNEPCFININYPDLPQKNLKGIKFTKLGKREYRDSYRTLYNNDHEIKMRFTGGISGLDDNDSDITELKNGYISITPLTLDCTDYISLEKPVQNFIYDKFRL